MIKQIIVIRKDLNMPTGKLVAQACHAAMKIFFDRMEDIHDDGDNDDRHTYVCIMNKVMTAWKESSFTKIVVGCDVLPHKGAQRSLGK